MIAQEIFKAYDIRGIVDQTLTDEAVKLIAQALSAQAAQNGVRTIAIGRDGRLSGARFAQILSQTFTDNGIDVLDIGMVATPMLYFTAHQYTQGSGVMITGSHNPPEYNGLKIMLAFDTLSGEAIQSLYQRIIQQNFLSGSLKGKATKKDISQEYQDYISNHIQLKRPMKIAIDAGNGVAGPFAEKLYQALGCQVTPLHCTIDGTFPNHHPDPAKPENLSDLIDCLKNSDAEIGLAFDGDGDRLGVVSKTGEIIWPDRQLMLFAADVLSRQAQAKIIYDVKCTRLLAPWIRQHHGEPILSKTGHSFIKAKIKEEQAALAGEMSGHLFFKERWFGFDDGIYAGARLLEILSASDNPSALLHQIPQALSTPEINIKMAKEGENHALIERLQQEAHFEGAQNIITIDGLRVEYHNGFGLIRASNTTPVLVLRFEADNEEALKTIQAAFAKILKQAGIDAPF